MHFKNNAHWEKYSKIYDKGAHISKGLCNSFNELWQINKKITKDHNEKIRKK